ncbi:MAG: cell wall metabolism sensor histidine kinase WalK, partial [Streptococcaceae bacterium]|nr:cell wall metabolism sensor histidine kinase WalK [Streptococcaceae bacterium]
MKEKTRFWQSVSFKIAVAFILLLLISIELIGNYFINTLEKTNIQNFKDGINPRVEQLASNLSGALVVQNHADDVDHDIQNQIYNFSMEDTLEIIVVDDSGIVRAALGEKAQNLLEKKSDNRDLFDYSLKHIERVEDGKRVYINVQPILNPNGDTTVGAIFVKSDIERIYGDIRNVSLIFLSATLISAGISIIVALFISRSITKPILEMKWAADRISRGDYSKELEIFGNDELSQLGMTFNMLSKKIETTQESIENEKNRLDTILSHMTDGVVSTDRRGHILMLNEMAISLLNVDRDNVLGKSVLDLLGIQETHSIRKILEEKSDFIVDVENKDGEVLTLHVDFSVVRRESGFISGLVAVLHDVTETRKNERERQQFVSNVSHELRTPLTSMKSYLEALSDGAYKDPSIAPDFLATSLEEANRMMRMITDLLNLSRMDAGAITLKKELVNFNDFLNYLLDRFDMIIKDFPDKNIEIKRFFTKESLWVEIDTDRMNQVIDNLMNNAIKYSPDGGVITVRLRRNKNKVL